MKCLLPAAHPLQMLPSTVTRAPGETALHLTLIVLSQSLPFLQIALPILSQHRPPGQSRGRIPSPPRGHDSGPHLHRADSLPLGHWTPSIASLLALHLSPLPIPQMILLEVQRVEGHPRESLKGCPPLLMPPGGLQLTCLRSLWRKYRRACGSLAYQRQLSLCSKGSELTAGSWYSWLRTSCHMISSWADSMSPRSHSSYRAGGPKSNTHAILVNVPVGYWAFLNVPSTVTHWLLSPTDWSRDSAEGNCATLWWKLRTDTWLDLTEWQHIFWLIHRLRLVY